MTSRITSLKTAIQRFKEALSAPETDPRDREAIPSHFRISSSGQLEPIFPRPILNVGHATPPVGLPQIGSS